MAFRRIFSLGEDTIFCDGIPEGKSWVLVGNTKNDGKYEIVLIKIDSDGNVIWQKNYGGEDEYEARRILKTEKGYLIGGNAHGKATAHGGEGWEGYVLMVDKNGNKLNERSYKIGGNDAIYDILEEKENFYIFGETEKQGKKSVFILSVNKNLEIEKRWFYGAHDDIFAGALTRGALSYSYSDGNKWNGRIIRKDENMGVIWAREIEDFLIYSMYEHNQSFFIGGSKKNKACIVKINARGEVKKEIVLGEGAIIHIFAKDERIIALGEINEHPAIYLLNEKLEITKEKIYESTTGWYEKGIMGNENKILALMYSSHSKEAVISEI